MRFILALVLVFAPALAQASCPTYFYPSTYVPPVTNITNVYNRFAVFDMTAPYAVGWYAGVYPPVAPAPGGTGAAAPSACEAKYAELSARFAALEAKLSAGPSAAPQPAPQSQPAQPPAAAPRGSGAILGGICAACHDAKVAESKGKGVVLTKGGITVAEFGPELIGRSMQAVTRGTMPPGHKLSADDFTTFVQELVNVSK